MYLDIEILHLFFQFVNSFICIFFKLKERHKTLSTTEKYFSNNNNLTFGCRPELLWELGSIQLITDHSLNKNTLQPQAALIVEGECEAHYVWASAAGLEDLHRNKLAPLSETRMSAAVWCLSSRTFSDRLCLKWMDFGVRPFSTFSNIF